MDTEWNETGEWIKLPEARRILGLSKSGIINRKDLGLMEFRMRQEGSHRYLYFRRSECERHAKVRPRVPRRTPLPVVLADREERIWLAGFFDGEGCICVCRTDEAGYGRWRMSISISNTAIECLEEVHSRFGGRTCRLGKDQRPSKWHLRPSAQWGATGDTALAILYALAPFLRVKHQQALLAIEFQEHVRAGNRAGVLGTEQTALDWREQQRLKISRLNRPNVPRE